MVDTMQDSHEVFSNLKDMLIRETRERHRWHAEVANNLRVIQINALEVRCWCSWDLGRTL